MAGVCRKPWKVAFTSRAFAVADGRRARQGRQKSRRGQLRPYRCGCGHWHLTSMDKKSFKLKSRRSVRGEPPVH